MGILKKILNGNGIFHKIALGNGIRTPLQDPPPSQFHGRAQPSSLDSFFERAFGLVNEVNRLLSTAENDEDIVEYCIARLENLLINCVNLFRIIEEQQYNSIIDAVQTFILMLRSRIPGDEGTTSSSSYSVPVHGFAVGKPPYHITFDQIYFLVGENFNTRRIANCLGVSVSTVRRRLRDNDIVGTDDDAKGLCTSGNDIEFKFCC